MPKTSLDSYYLLRWDFSRQEVVERDVVQAAHRLGELPLATDEGLDQLLEKIPAGALSIHSMGGNPAYPSEWQRGVLGDVEVPAIIDLIRRGRLSVTISRIDRHDTKIAALAGRLSRELQECHVGLRITEPHLDLILSSPNSQYYFGCDATASVLCQLRGRMRLRVYPNDDRYIRRSEHQQIAYQQQHQRLYYEPAFDRQSRVFDVEPGQLISWPQPRPYRIECLNGLNLSLRLTFQTPRSIRQTNVHLVNRFLCSWLPEQISDDRIGGLSGSLKQLLAAFIRPRQASSDQQPQPTFRLDAQLPGGGHSLPQQVDGGQSSPTIGLTSAGGLDSPAAAVVLES